jgi:hypothetical protein
MTIGRLMEPPIIPPEDMIFTAKSIMHVSEKFDNRIRRTMAGCCKRLSSFTEYLCDDFTKWYIVVNKMQISQKGFVFVRSHKTVVTF